MNSLEEPRHILSVDVDDWVIAACQFAGVAPSAEYGSCISKELSQVLALMAEYGVRATFFISTQYFEKDIALLQEIVDQGHTLGSHGHRHYDASRMTLSEFSDDLEQSLAVLQRCQAKIQGYRSPGFSMPFDEQYLDALSRYGFRYVSSLPGRNMGVKLDGIEPSAFANGLLHIPITVVPLIRKSIGYPIGSAAVSRLMPPGMYFWTLRNYLKRSKYFHYYFHPFEVAGLARRKACPGWRPKYWLFTLRCKKREPLFRRLFELCPFKPIESMLCEKA